MNPNLATTLNLGLAQATPKSKSVPSLTAAALPGSSSPAGEEAITPKRVEELVENSVQKAALAAEVLQHDTGMSKSHHFIASLPHFHQSTHIGRVH